MPYINTTTSVSINDAQIKKLTKELGRAITLIPGKSEKWLMLNFTSDAKMAFRGDCSTPSAMLEVEIFGKAKESDLQALTERLCEVVSEILAVPSDRIYVKYREVDRWGWNGMNF